MSVGRRWYLVAWDVRRDDWRTFRVDRVSEPRLAGVRFAARALPGGDAAAFVARAFRSMPMAHVATVEVRASADELAEVARWLEGHDAVAWVRGDLPEEADEPRITKNDSDSDPVMRIAITSDRMSPAEITETRRVLTILFPSDY